MYKWMYDRMVTEYSKKSKEELVKRIMSLEEIECSDRCFANQCMAGSSMYDINELFSALEDRVSARFSSFNLERSERLTYLASLNLVGSSGWPGNRLGVSPAVAWR